MWHVQKLYSEALVSKELQIKGYQSETNYN